MKKSKKLVSTLLLVSLISLTGCSKKENTIVGKWETKLGTSSYIYTFNDDKTCSYNAAGTLMKCTYKTNDNKLSILYDGDTASFDTSYKIENNKLIIKDSLDNDVVYEKQ